MGRGQAHAEGFEGADALGDGGAGHRHADGRQRPSGTGSCGRGCAKQPKRCGPASHAAARLEEHPCCVDCYNLLRRQGSYKGSPMFWCPGCGGRFCCSRPTKRRPVLPDDRPCCVACPTPMNLGGAYRGVARFLCRGCGASCAARRTKRVGRPGMRDGNGSKLAALINSLMPAHCPAEVRKDVEQAMAQAVLERRLRRRDLTRAKALEFGRAFFKASQNRFRDVSLEHNVREGLRLEDVLEG